MKNQSLMMLSMASGLGVALVVLGGLFMALRFVGGRMILLAGLIVVAVVCLLWLINVKKKLPKDMSTKDEAMALKNEMMLYMTIMITLISICALCVGIIFKMLQLAGATQIIFASGFTVFIMALCLPVYIVKHLNSRNDNE